MVRPLQERQEPDDDDSPTLVIPAAAVKFSARD
jgi:hypothetical protein